MDSQHSFLCQEKQPVSAATLTTDVKFIVCVCSIKTTSNMSKLQQRWDELILLSPSMPCDTNFNEDAAVTMRTALDSHSHSYFMLGMVIATF